MPPLSGFIGKLQILDAARDSDAMVWIWSIILVTSLMCIVGFGRAGSVLFWKSSSVDGEITVQGAKWPVLPIIASCGMVGALIVLTVFAGPISDYLQGAALQLFDTSQYIEAVLGENALSLVGQ